MKKPGQKSAVISSITRRDFIAGVAVSLSGNLLSCSWAETETPEAAKVYYPPTRTGMRGSHPGSFEVAHQLRNGKKWPASEVEDTAEYYDLVVVGGGMSGLSAAWFYREKNPQARILILDNHDDFGGHAKRNEFWSGNKLQLSHGGTINISDFSLYGEAAQRLIRSLGIDPERYNEFYDDKLHPKLGLRKSIFFDKETFGTDRLVTGAEELPWNEFLAKTPLSQTARDDIQLLHETKTDYLSELDTKQKRQRLRQLSYQQYLIDVVGIHPDSLDILRENGNWAIGIDALSALTAASEGSPGTQGLGLVFADHQGQYFRFPDGNSSITRLLVRSLIPSLAPGQGMEDILTAKFDYKKLDTSESAIRIRLQSTVISVRHLGDPQTAKQVEITYVKDGQARSIRAGKSILACYNLVIPYICDELPKVQKQALANSLKAPLVYTSVLIRNWQAFVKLGVSRIHCPGSYFNSVRLSLPFNMGDYQHAKSPAEPTILHLVRIPLTPGLSAQQQWKIGRMELLTTSFETFERNIRDQLDLILSPGGFDSSRDIEAITVNRWPHGYAFGQNPETGEIAYLRDEVPAEIAPWHAARKPFGRIAIANSDAAANAMTEGAIGEAHRAVLELLST